MRPIKSNIAEAVELFGGLDFVNFGNDRGFYLVLVKVKEGNTSGHRDTFEVMGRKFGEINTGVGYNAYRITDGNFDSAPVRIDFGEEGQWHLLT